MKKLTLLLLTFALIFTLSSCGTETELTLGDGNGNNNGSSTSAPIDVTMTEKLQEVTCYADIVIRDYGTIVVALDGVSAPETVSNFVSLAKSGFYDGLTFHRIIANFMMQGGDPKGNGTGGSDKNIVGEFAANGVNNPLSHIRGAISMARSSAFNSASSQFFIVHADSTYLDGNYAVFGYVVSGLDVVDAVCADAKPTDGNGSIAKSAQPVITKVTIRDAK